MKTEKIEICTSTLSEFYQSDLADSHAFGKGSGGYNGRAIVYAAKIRGVVVGWLTIQHNSSRTQHCIKRLITKDWNKDISRALLRRALTHQGVYAITSSLDTQEYFRQYEGLMHEVSRKEIPLHPLFKNDIPVNFDWSVASCTKLLQECPAIHQKLIESVQALGIRIRDGGKAATLQESKEKLKNLNRAVTQFRKLRPNVQMRFRAD